MADTDTKLLCHPDEKADLEIVNQAKVVELLEYIVSLFSGGKSRLTEGDLLDLHRLTIEGIYPCAGTFRDARTRIEITGTEHQPAEPAQVRSQVRDLLYWMYDGDGRDVSPVRKAAYVLWQINAIHPFNGGNGRVARAAAYLVILTEVGPVFAGEPLPMKLKKKKADYISALQSADRGNLDPMETLVLDCFEEQLDDLSRVAQKKPLRHP